MLILSIDIVPLSLLLTLKTYYTFIDLLFFLLTLSKYFQAYSDSSAASMELFAEIVNGFQLLTSFAKAPS